MTKPPELLPCPFCGCETVENWSESTWSRPVMWMYCAECNAKGPRVMMQRNEESEDWLNRAIAAWNTRAPDPAVQALVEARAAWEAFKGATVSADHFDAVERLNAALAAFDKTD